MSTRTVPVQVNNEYIKGSGVPVGAAGSHNDVVLEISFSALWDGLAKKITWLDAKGENPTLTILTTDMLKTGETSVYLVKIPAEPKAYAGDMTMTIKGATVSGGVETRATLSTSCTFRVLPSAYDSSADESGDVTPTQAEQLQAEIDTIIGTISEAAASATAAAASETAAAASATGAEAAKSAAETARDTALHAKEDAVAAIGIANASVSKSATSAALAESWAIGGTNTRPGENENNSMYYSQLSKNAMQAAAESRDAADASEELSRSQAQLSMNAREHAESIADEVRGNAALTEERADSALASCHSAQRAANIADTRAATAGQQANSATKSADAAAISAAEAQAAVERAKVPAAVGVYNVVITDRNTDIRYALMVESGILKLLQVASDLDAAVITLIDTTDGTAYELISESGILKLKEV